MFTKSLMIMGCQPITREKSIILRQLFRMTASIHIKQNRQNLFLYFTNVWKVQKFTPTIIMMHHFLSKNSVKSMYCNVCKSVFTKYFSSERKFLVFTHYFALIRICQDTLYREKSSYLLCICN